MAGGHEVSQNQSFLLYFHFRFPFSDSAGQFGEHNKALFIPGMSQSLSYVPTGNQNLIRSLLSDKDRKNP